ncbi:MAG: iron-containing alcohol dehydrogenase [Bacteroidetes bacterium]|nr:iron-containing alcohol dehydrogenase [Bacteroidota bacterium]MDA0874518.1 iron-containing alcohol dehydrogenase [Bacteroidota bacterium]
MTPLHASSFSVHVPTDIRFGAGKLADVGAVVAALGRRCLLVTGPSNGSVGRLLPRVLGYLKDAGVETAHFDGVIPNPTTDTIRAGADKAKAHRADVILGLGGGSSMDAAKAIAVETTHPGSCWDYLFYRDQKPTDKTLPVVAVSTTSGTGSQVTQVSVVTHTATRDKSALYNSLIFPRVAIVDPELMTSAPKHVTACTGFDAFTHAFESILHPNTNPYVQLLGWEAIWLVLNHLPTALDEPENMEARSALAWADTLAGICIAVAGVTLPHGVGMAIGGMYPHVAHGEALALNYPAFMRYTCAHAEQPFARLGRLLNPALATLNEKEAALRACDEMDGFLKRIGLWMGLKDKGIPREELPALARQSMVLPDYKNNPRLATEAEMLALLEDCYTR